eukprot:9312917-Pyramimonas_sp.AAC.1
MPCAHFEKPPPGGGESMGTASRVLPSLTTLAHTRLDLMWPPRGQRNPYPSDVDDNTCSQSRARVRCDR